MNREDVSAPVSACPICGHRFDSATMLTRRGRPNAGDVSLCIQCGAVNLFADDLTVREPTAEEMARLRGSGSWPEIQQIVKAIKRVQARRG